MKKKILIMILSMFISFPLFSASPTILLGLGIKALMYPDEAGVLYNDYLGSAGGFLSYRNKLTDIGYYNFLTDITGNFIQTEPYLHSDEEIFSLETGFQFENSTLICIAGFRSSVNGTETNIPFYRPDWELRYFFITERKKIQPFISYQGYYFMEPDNDDDIFYEGIEIGIKQRPSITHGYQLSFGVGWEYWPEYLVYTLSGIPSNEDRNDLLGMLNGKVNGIFDFFLDWEILLSIIYRWSNANTYSETRDYVTEKSEDRIVISSEIKLEWSPSRYLHITLHPFCSPEFYLNKQVVTEKNILTSEKVWSVTSGGIFNINWTPDNKFYAFVETEGLVYISNDVNDVAWNVLCHLGLEYNLKF